MTVPVGPARPAPTEVPVLAITAVTAGYGRTTVLRDVNVTVPSGRVVALLGSNGAGKTTLLRVAAGLLRPASGTVSIHGVDVTRRPPYQRARQGLSIVPEGRGIFRGMTVRDNLMIGRGRAGRGDRLAPTIDLFPELSPHLAQVAGTLSGGQQQMLSLARCYLADPSLMLLDELSMGLAPIVIDKIYSRIAELARTGTAVLLVEQYIHRALQMAELVYVLERGRVAVSGTAEEMRDHDMMSRYLGASAEMSDLAPTGPAPAGPAGDGGPEGETNP
ncbi:MAG TPA: ABC transporter ATP-binding protein [Acidimicrobiales bacterium]|nr:ABC transporter ATP-binding protein [Acidimicrobiales bacterium]